jgi:hypothetical protein
MLPSLFSLSCNRRSYRRMISATCGCTIWSQLSSPSAQNDRLNLQGSAIDQGLEGSELSLYTNGTWSGVMIRAMSRTMTLATPSTGSLAW